METFCFDIGQKKKHQTFLTDKHTETEKRFIYIFPIVCVLYMPHTPRIIKFLKLFKAQILGFVNCIFVVEAKSNHWKLILDMRNLLSSKNGFYAGEKG